MQDAIKDKYKIIDWIQMWFSLNGPNSPAVIGISGGKDSSICAALLKEALGKDRVIGVMMPNGSQWDIKYSMYLIEQLGIKGMTFQIRPMVDAFYETLKESKIYDIDWGEGHLMHDLNSVCTSNLPARVRMTSLYAIAAQFGGRVCNTCNLSEDWVGYATKFGDNAGDFAPIQSFTVTEVKMIGLVLGLDEKLIDKVPEDGLSGKTDEDNLGFTYEVLDKYIREGICEDNVIKEKIDLLKKLNKHKLELMPKYQNYSEVWQ